MPEARTAVIRPNRRPVLIIDPHCSARWVAAACALIALTGIRPIGVLTSGPKQVKGDYHAICAYRSA
jgi:hypothetical protein